MPTGQPVDETITYADLSDVQRYLRGFEFSANSNPTDTQVEDWIDDRTRFVEKNTPTAFRTLEISDVKVNVTPSEKQKRRRPRRAGNGSRAPSATATSDKYIKIYLPHDHVQSVSNVRARTDAGINTVDPEDYELDSRRGIIKVKYKDFPSTLSGRADENRLEGAEIHLDYQYGRTYVENDIKNAVAKLVVYDIINSDSFGQVRSDDENFVDPEEFTSRIKDEAESVLESYS